MCSVVVTERLTPVMRQYLDVKGQNPDAILFFRLGDFYEMFFDDAILVSGLLNLTLTSREKGEDAVPMCGVPHHSARTYIGRLLEKGYKIAVCEQMEDPQAAKGIVKREVTRILTPGMVFDEDQLDSSQGNFIASVCGADGKFGIAHADISTGEFRVTEIEGIDAAGQEIARLRPKEALLPEASGEEAAWVPEAEKYLNNCLKNFKQLSVFNREKNERLLLGHFGILTLESFGCEKLGPGIGAAGALLAYVTETQKRRLAHMCKITPYRVSEYMLLDEATKTNLELFETAAERRRKGSLLWVLDRTSTPMGSRLLARWLNYPLTNAAGIDARLESVVELAADSVRRGDLKERLSGIRDMMRLNGKVAAEIADPRDLAALRDSLGRMPALKEAAGKLGSAALADAAGRLDDLMEVRERLEKALVESPPLAMKEGGIFREGFNQEIDELREAKKSGKDFIAKIEAEEKRRTGIASLKVRYNRVFGYYIEVSKSNLKLVPQDYARKQTLANAERFVTEQLKQYEEKVLKAEERLFSLEHDLFCETRKWVAGFAARIAGSAAAVAEIDVFLSLAEVAAAYSYVKPEITDEAVLEVADGRHPVLERMSLGEGFVPNDVKVDADSEQVLIITGPNMAGKSTVIRQAALIQLMGQVGSFVPAARARIGIADRIFTRVGAADILTRGLSTFMVEMVETSNILHNATRRSLIVLDEIGRGTSTFDGLSIAWSVAEYIHDAIGARALFATHYHELGDLARTKARVKNYNIAVKEWGEKIIFLRKMVPGVTNRSYGIQVGRLAGLPDAVITRAKEVLQNLEKGELDEIGQPRIARKAGVVQAKGPAQFDLFLKPRSAVEEELKGVDPDALTPKEALDVLYRLKEKLGGSSMAAKRPETDKPG